MPYLFAQSVKAAQTGVPVMRPMVMEYPNDPLCYTLDTQYMLGDSLLVAPVFNENGQRSLYLPEGEFTNFFTGEVVQGGRMIHGTYDYMTLPVFVPPNTLLAVGSDCSVEYNYNENVTIYAYCITEQTLDLFDKDGVKRAVVMAKRVGDDIVFAVEGDAPDIKFKKVLNNGII